MLLVPSEGWTEITCIDVVESDHWLRFQVNVGMRRPLYCTAPGLVMLAFAPLDLQRTYLDSTRLVQMTSETVTTKKGLLHLLAKARADGVMVSCASVEGATGVAAPIFGADGNVMASVSVAGLSARINRDIEKLTTLVRQSAEQMSRALGLTHAYPPL